MSFALTSPVVTMVHFPTWENGFGYSKEYKSYVTFDIVGNEQRTAILSKPHREVTYDIETVGYTESSLFRKNIQLFKNSVWWVPLWNFDMTLTSAITNPTSTSIAVSSTQYRDMSLTTDLVIYNRYNDYKNITMTTPNYDNTTIYFSGTITQAFTTHAKVYPLMRGLLNQVSYSVVHPNMIKASLQFVESFRGTEV